MKDANVESVISLIPDILGHGRGSALIEKFRERVKHGLGKYGVTTERTDLTREEWIMHAIEEHMDSCVYLARLESDANTDGSDKLALQFGDMLDAALCSLCTLWEILNPQDVR